MTDVAAWIQAVALRHHLPAGTPLPSERQLSLLLNTHRITIGRAVQRLLAEGILARSGKRLVLSHRPARLAPTLAIAAATSHARELALSIARAHGCPCIDLGAHDPSHLPARLIKEFERGARGFLINSNPSYFSAAEWIHNRGGVCAMWGSAQGAMAHSVSIDVRAAMRAAVDHLLAQGHTRVGFVTSPRTNLIYLASDHPRLAFLEACRLHQLPDPADHILSIPFMRQPALAPVVESLETFLASRPEVTSLIIGRETLSPLALAALERLGKRIPTDLAVLAYGEPPASEPTRLKLTRVVGDADAEITLLTLLLIHRTSEALLSGQPARPCHLSLHPRLIRGDTTFPPHAPQCPPATRSPLSGPILCALPEAERRRLVEDSWRVPYSHALRGDIQPFDLRPWLNRSVTQNNGWLGDLPLLHFPPGIRLIHGVPFAIVDERRNHGRSALVLRSQTARSAAGAPLPLLVRIPLRRCVPSLYALHACGFAEELRAIAHYRFVTRSGLVHSIPLIVQGGSSRSEPRPHPPPNVQDWWPDYEQIEAPHARTLIVCKNGDPLEYCRFLYSLEWINPAPEDPIEEMQIEVEKEQPETFAVLALSLETDRSTPHGDEQG